MATTKETPVTSEKHTDDLALDQPKEESKKDEVPLEELDTFREERKEKKESRRAVVHKAERDRAKAEEARRPRWKTRGAPGSSKTKALQASLVDSLAKETGNKDAHFERIRVEKEAAELAAKRDKEEKERDRLKKIRDARDFDYGFGVRAAHNLDVSFSSRKTSYDLAVFLYTVLFLLKMAIAHFIPPFGAVYWIENLWRMWRNHEQLFPNWPLEQVVIELLVNLLPLLVLSIIWILIGFVFTAFVGKLLGAGSPQSPVDLPWHGLFASLTQKKFKFSRIILSPDDDLRADTIALQELKHSGCIAEVTFQQRDRWMLLFWKTTHSTTLTVSIELLSQIVVARNLSLNSTDEIVWERINHMANSFSTVNLNRYEGVVGNHVVQDTVLVAFAHWKQLQERRAVVLPDFLRLQRWPDLIAHSVLTS